MPPVLPRSGPPSLAAMSEQGLELARQVMADGGVHPRAIEVFSHNYRLLESGETGVIAEDDVEPVTDLPRLDELDVDPDAAREALGACAVIKLNGGLGTSMGMSRAKSLLPVRGERDLPRRDRPAGACRPRASTACGCRCCS